jgi:hypothetical protein
MFDRDEDAPKIWLENLSEDEYEAYKEARWRYSDETKRGMKHAKSEDSSREESIEVIADI